MNRTEAEKLDDFVHCLVEQANDNMALMDGTTVPVKRLIDDNDIAVGIWHDEAEPYGVGILILKGAKLMRDLAIRPVLWRAP
jgi:hypothetical protein